jgi:periplasmic copper chaperone A
MMRRGAAICAIGCVLVSPTLAQAHISLHPNAIPAGAFVTLNVRVPGEQAGAYAYKVDMLVPPGFTEIDTQNVPGWSVKEVMRKLTTPIQTDDGPVSEEVSEIVWSGDRTQLGRLEDGQFIQFPLSIAMPADIAGRTLAFKAVQYYSNGKVVHWIGSPSAEYPAPTIEVTAKGGAIEDIASSEAGPSGGQGLPSGHTTAGSSFSSSSSALAGTAHADSGASKGLGIAALILGALGLLTGGIALMLALRGRR